MDKYMNMQDCRNILRIIREGSCWSSPELLFDVEEDLAAVGFGTDGEVNPVGSAATFEYQLVEVLMGAVGDVE